MNTKQELRTLAITGLFLLLIASAIVATVADIKSAGLYLLCSVLVCLFGWQQSRKRLHLNYSQSTSSTDPALYPDLGLANRMTLLRGWLIAATSGFLLIPDALFTHSSLVWTAAALYSAAAILDRVDGFIARRTQRSSLLGSELDTLFDALGLLIAPLLALQLGKIHWSYLLVSVAYYIFASGIRYREKHNEPVYPLPPSKLRRTLAGFQMAYIAVVLWPPFDAEVTMLAGFGFMLPLLAGFILDWLAVSGRIRTRPQSASMPDTARRLSRLTAHVLMPLSRGLLVLALLLMFTHLNTMRALPEFYIVAIAAVALIMVALGLAGRAAAALLLMLLAWTVPIAVYAPAFIVSLFAAIAILLFGCGRLSVWQADDDWINRQDGA